MEELTLQELQQASLGILADVHDFCEKNGIHYSIDYGTLIGALRHKGFIPWDDDVDIVMPRPDFEKFCQTYHSDNYQIIYYGNDSSALAAFSRVVDCKNTHYETVRPWTKQESGVWIDIFPIDGVEENAKQYEKRYNRLKKMGKVAYKFRRQNHHKENSDSTWSKLMTAIAPILGLRGKLPAWIINKMVNIMSRIPYGSTPYVGQCSCLDDGPIQFPIEDFKEYVLLPFEQYEFYAISGYDHHLRQLYGDYMQLPPENQRKPKQSWIHFYKKN
ncbi:MAG: LicD family protein [Bacteroidales bacterium]|nr:LicD family protein [Bacteroidales bacterium]